MLYDSLSVRENMENYDLSFCPLFNNLSADEIAEIMRRVVSEVRVVEKGSYVVRQGDTIQFLFLLTEGLVRTEMINDGINSLHKRNLTVLDRKKLEPLI